MDRFHMEAMQGAVAYAGRLLWWRWLRIALQVLARRGSWVRGLGSEETASAWTRVRARFRGLQLGRLATRRLMYFYLAGRRVRAAAKAMRMSMLLGRPRVPGLEDVAPAIARELMRGL